MTGLYTAVAAIIITICGAAIIFITAATLNKRTRDALKRCTHRSNKSECGCATGNHGIPTCAAMAVPYRKLSDNAVAPTYGSACAAGADLRALLDEPATIGATPYFACPQGHFYGHS